MQNTKFAVTSCAMDVAGSTPEEFTAFIRKQIDIWTAVAKAANVRAD